MGPEEEHETLINSVLDIAKPTRGTVIIGITYSEEAFESVNEDYDGKAAPDELAKRSDEVRVAADRLSRRTFNTRFGGHW